MTAPALRPACLSDTEAVAPLLCAPRPGLLDIYGDSTTAHRVARALFRSPRSMDSHRNALVALEDERVLGIVTTIPQEEQGRFRIPTGLTMLAAAPWSLPKLVRRGGVMDQVSAPLPSGCTFISCLAVHPSTRGKGLGKALIGRVRELAKSQGRSLLALDVGMDNEGAIRFYTVQGFQAVAQHPCSPAQRKILDFSGHLRMEMKL